MFEVRNCLVCNNNKSTFIFNKLLIKCNICGFVTANLNIESSEAKSIYSEKYFKGEEYEDYLRDKIFIQSNFYKRIQQIKKSIDREFLTNILEIGCAYGFFGELAIKEWQCNYLGVDIAYNAIEYARHKLNLNAICEDYLSKENTGIKYDTVFMWDVIEHLPNPHSYLKKIGSEIRDGGYVVITTGDIGSLLAKIQGRKWRMIHPPSHLHYFDKMTIKKLLNNSGFDIQSVYYPAILRSLKQIFFSLFLLNKESNFFLTKIYNSIPKSLCFSLNFYDIMFIIAKKK